MLRPMSIWGKLAGAAAGLAVGGPIGALLGGFAGHYAIDRDKGDEEAGENQVAFTVGVIALAAAVEGWLLGPARPWQRVVLAVGALLLVAPPIWSHGAGFALVALILGVQWLARRPAVGAQRPMSDGGGP